MRGSIMGGDGSYAMKRWLWLLPLLLGCQKKFDRETLLDPQTCQTCHPDHYREWSGSMHAYAADDPVFLAMNARGQRETDGALGDFCVQCHAPMAVREGLTTDGLNLSEVPQHMKGVTCYFCHNIEQVESDHNGQVKLANDDVMRGGISDPVDSEAHNSAYSSLHDRNDPKSSDLCGGCHDIVTPKGVHLERTFSEWRESLYAHNTPQELQSCGNCHMQGRDGLAAMADGVALRRVRDHSMVGVDIALTDFPEMEAQRAGIQKMLDTTLVAQMCISRVMGGVEVTLDLENLAAGHYFPSGAAHDRRAWAEVIGYLGPSVRYSSGVVADDQAIKSIDDPDLWLMRDQTFNEQDEEVHMFWDIARVESTLLPVPTAISPLEPDYRDPHVKKTYRIDGAVDRITARVRIRPLGLDVIDDLIASGDLDPSIRAKIPTFDLGATVLEWSAEDGEGCFPEI